VTRLALLVARRLLGIAVLAWVASAVTFGLLRVGIPNPGIDAAVSQQLGPGQPAVVQYAHYVEHLLHGNLGQSLTAPVSVDTILRQAIPPTLSLLLGGMVLWLAAGIATGAVSALRPGSWTDRAATVGVLAAVSAPSFMVALLLLAVFAHLAQHGNLWLQPGYVGLTDNPGQWLGRMILPWIAVAAGQVGVTARLTRTGILEILGEDYIRTARAKGLTGRRILWFHVLRAALLPVVSSIGVGFGMILGSAAVIDQVFALGGLGQAFLTATTSGDLLVVIGVTLATVVLVALVNLIADVGYALLSPRVRIS
jgi:peptide/nickel transport system permease protein